MTKKLFFPVAGVALAAFAACNSSEPIDYEYTQSSSTQVTAFYLTENQDVLDSLQNVFFSIDQVNAQIFNADSLPYGTKIDKLIPSISTESNVSMVQLEIPRVNMSDSIVDFLTNSTDSIDFSNGPVKLRVRSQSSTAERLYEIRVNVHQVKPDTLAWKQVFTGKLPVYMTNITDSKTLIGIDGNTYCLATNGTEYELMSSKTPLFYTGNPCEFRAPAAQAVVSSLCAGKNAYFMLDADGNLLTAPTLESAWTTANSEYTWKYLYGIYPAASGDIVLGCATAANGAYSIVAFDTATAAAAAQAMPKGFPVSGTSALTSFSTTMSLTSTALMTSGIDADGNVSSATWGFDGTNWAKLSYKPIAKELKGMAMVAYDLFQVKSTNWKPEQYPALLAFGGSNAEGINRTVYYSRDWGLTWAEAPQLLQLPADVVVTSDASSFVFSYTLSDNDAAARSASLWEPVAIRALPPHCSWVDGNAPLSRVTSPITSWECPVIYLFGGYDANGHAANTAWQGAVLRYTFCPKY